MIKKFKSSLFAKVFLLTAAMLLGISLLGFGMLAWLMPQTYSNRLNAILDERAGDFISELEKTTFSDSGGLFDCFIADMEIDSVELYNSGGDLVPLPTDEWDDEWTGAVAQVSLVEAGNAAPVLSNNYFFSFSDSGDRYMLIVYGTAEETAELRQSFIRVFPADGFGGCVCRILALLPHHYRPGAGHQPDIGENVLFTVGLAGGRGADG